MVESTLGSLVEDARAPRRRLAVDRRHRRHGGPASPSCRVAGRLAMTSGLIVAAPRSGAGKTTVTIGLMRALSAAGLGRAGLQVRARLHRSRLPRRGDGPAELQSRHLGDGARRRSAISSARHPADIVVTEGVMGLFDGVAAAVDARGATADLAALLGWPVVLVLDVSGQTETAAAVAAGLRALSRRRRHRRRDPQSGREPAPSRPDHAGLRARRAESVRRARPRRAIRLAGAPSRPGPGGRDGRYRPTARCVG